MFLLPKKFLCRWPLRTGALVVGVVMLVTMFVAMIATLVQAISMSNHEWQQNYFSRNAYGYSIAANLYAVMMFLLQAGFVYAVAKKPAPAAALLLGWAALTAAWLLLVLVLFLVLIILYAHAVSITSWLVSLVLGLVAFCILLYGWVIGIAYFVELQSAGGEAGGGGGLAVPAAP